MRIVIVVLSILFFTACKENSGEKNRDQPKKNLEKTIDTLPKKTSNEIDTTLIDPGKALGNIILQENPEPVYGRYGTPDKGDAAMGKSVSTWYLPQGNKNYLLTIFTSRKMGVESFSRIVMIRTTSIAYATKSGIGPGSDKVEIEQKFKLKKVGSFKEGEKTYQLYDTSQGIAFEFGENDVCHGVLIHNPKVDATTSYIPIYENLKKTN